MDHLEYAAVDLNRANRCFLRAVRLHYRLYLGEGISLANLAAADAAGHGAESVRRAYCCARRIPKMKVELEEVADLNLVAHMP